MFSFQLDYFRKRIVWFCSIQPDYTTSRGHRSFNFRVGKTQNSGETNSSWYSDVDSFHHACHEHKQNWKPLVWFWFVSQSVERVKKKEVFSMECVYFFPGQVKYSQIILISFSLLSNFLIIIRLRWSHLITQPPFQLFWTGELDTSFIWTIRSQNKVFIQMWLRWNHCFVQWIRKWFSFRKFISISFISISSSISSYLSNSSNISFDSIRSVTYIRSDDRTSIKSSIDNSSDRTSIKKSDNSLIILLNS